MLLYLFTLRRSGCVVLATFEFINPLDNDVCLRLSVLSSALRWVVPLCRETYQMSKELISKLILNLYWSNGLMRSS